MAMTKNKQARAVTSRDPCTVTSAANHGLSNGDWVTIGNKQFRAYPVSQIAFSMKPVRWYHRAWRWLTGLLR